MNQSIMMGRLVQDPQIKYIENSKGDEMAVANFRLAVNRKFSEETDYFPCSAFGRLAEFAEKYLFKGIKIVVNGRMENNNYTTKEGDKVYGVCFKLDDIEFAESKNAGQDQDEDEGGSRSRGSGNRRGSSGGRGSSSGGRSGSRGSGSSRGDSGRSGRSSGSSRSGYQSNGSRNSRSSRDRNVDEEFEGMEDGYFD